MSTSEGTDSQDKTVRVKCGECDEIVEPEEFLAPRQDPVPTGGAMDAIEEQKCGKCPNCGEVFGKMTDIREAFEKHASPEE